MLLSLVKAKMSCVFCPLIHWIGAVNHRCSWGFRRIPISRMFIHRNRTSNGSWESFFSFEEQGLHVRSPPFNPGIFGGGGVRPEISEKYSTWLRGPVFFGLPGRVLRMPNFILDISGYIGYIKWIYIDQKRKPRMTSANSYSWSLKIFRNGIILLQWNLWGGGF